MWIVGKAFRDILPFQNLLRTFPQPGIPGNQGVTKRTNIPSVVYQAWLWESSFPEVRIRNEAESGLDPWELSKIRGPITRTTTIFSVFLCFISRLWITRTNTVSYSHDNTFKSPSTRLHQSPGKDIPEINSDTWSNLTKSFIFSFGF